MQKVGYNSDNYLKFATLLIMLFNIFSETRANTALALVSERKNVINNNISSSVFGMGGRLPYPPKVKVNKCCHYSEHLDMTKSCVPGNSKNWVPHIFLINRRTNFSPKGESPKFMLFAENVRPANDIEYENDILINKTTNHTNLKVGCKNTELELFLGSDNIILFSNGSLYLRERSQFIEPKKYCVDREAALVCFPKQHYKKDGKILPKLKKCCAKHGFYNTTAKNCQFDIKTNDYNLPVKSTDFHIIYGFPKCRNASLSFAIAGEFADAELHNKSGVLKLHGKDLVPEDYCLEHIMLEEATIPLTDNKSINNSSLVKVFICLHHFENLAGNIETFSMKRNKSSERLQVAVLNIAIIISVVFLAATLVAGYLIPSVHHLLHWRCQIYYIFCLFVGDLLLAYTQLSQHTHLGTVICTLIASAMHFFFLSSFFWLNTMCFNIWWTFRDFRPSSLERNQELFRLRLYSAYAWGMPLLIAVVALCVDQMQSPELLKPGFGERSCWFSGNNMEIFAYFFGPVGILLCANITLFISTTHQLTCGLWKRDDVKSTTEKTALGKVCLKLVIVMGVTWIADVLSWIIGGPHSAWFFTDLINALQGVFIFLVVGCQPQVWSAVKRLCCSRVQQEITNTTNGVHHSSSSHGLPSLTACAEATQITTANATQQSASIASLQRKIPMETVC